MWPAIWRGISIAFGVSAGRCFSMAYEGTPGDHVATGIALCLCALLASMMYSFERKVAERGTSG